MSFQKAKIAGVNVCGQEYHRLKNGVKRGDPKFVMSPSALKAFARLPSRWIRGWEPPETKSLEWGNLVDCRTLTPELFHARYSVQPLTYLDTKMVCPKCKSQTDSKTCRACGVERIATQIEIEWDNRSTHCSDWNAAQREQGKEVVTYDGLAECDKAVQRLFEPMDGDDTIKRFYDASERQVLLTGEWHDEDTGLIIPVSALLDLVPRGDSEFADNAGDFKSTVSAHPVYFKKQAFKYGYHIQAAFDLDLLNAATGQERTTWCFIIQENFAPYEPNRAIYGQDTGIGEPSFLDVGRMESFGGYRALLKLYCRCLKENKWPGYNSIGMTVQGWCVLRPDMYQIGDVDNLPQLVKEPEPEQEPEGIVDGMH